MDRNDHRPDHHHLPPVGRLHTRSYQAAHQVRILASTAAVLLIMLGLVRLWPITEDEPSRLIYRADVETIQVEEILQTAQGASVPPPPLPPVPIDVPTDFLVDEPDLNFDVTLPDVAQVDPIGHHRDAAADETSGPTVREAARPVRFVEPDYTADARRRQVRAEILVQLHVSSNGRVEETEILARYLLDGNPPQKTAVAEIGFGLEEAALAAAQRWVFRPARVDGSRVESIFEVTFSFGD